MKKKVLITISFFVLLIFFGKTDPAYGFPVTYSSCSGGLVCEGGGGATYIPRYCHLNSVTGLCGIRTEDEQYFTCTSIKCVALLYDGNCASLYPTGLGTCETVFSSARAGCCVTPTCTPSTQCVCSAPTYADTSQGFGSKAVTCADGCGGNADDTCYCTSNCTPPSCPAGTSKSGSGELQSTQTCTNACARQSSRNCYSNCSTANCSDLPALPDGRTWEDICPVGSTCSEVETTVPIPSPPTGCDSSEVKTCYIVNAQPKLESLEIQPGLFTSLNYYMAKTKSPIFDKLIKSVKAQEQEAILGFTSNTRTGTQLNNPVKLNATFSDLDGNDDISAIYIWWSKDSDTKDFTTPNKLGTSSAQTEKDSSFGFMVKRIGASWGIVYVPSFADLLAPKWVVPTPLEKIFGPYQKNAINLYSVFLTDSVDRPNEVDFSVLLDMPSEGDIDKILNGTYHVWTLVNDIVGFLPFGDDEEIENDSWDDTGEDGSEEEWNVDLVDPIFTVSPSIVTNLDGDIEMTFTVSDNEDDASGLSYVRVDACRSGGITPIPTISSNLPYNTDPYIMSDCSSFSVEDITANTDLLGSEGEILGALSYSPANLNINLNGNEGGSITFRITVMDNAGNFIYRDVVYALGEWAITTDGLVYGYSGVSSTTES